jgi:citrate lyase subunit beta/citryl-CoA lyase
VAVSPRDALFEAGQARPQLLPVCDHYAGVEARMVRSLALQAQMGPVFDVTLDNEDGAPVGGETDQAHLISHLLNSADNRFGRVGVRLLPVTDARFDDVARIVLKSSARPAYLMLPKPLSLADVECAAAALDGWGAAGIPLHALIETHGALHDVFAIAAHPRIESLSFGLLDFISAHRGAIPRSAMGVAGQFDHPLVLRAKLDIAAACHAHGKTPSHCVVTEFKAVDSLAAAARTAATRLGYTRMWSIHPAQIPVIVEALSPGRDEVAQAVEILLAAQRAGWAPISHAGALHDRASYRYFWQVVEREHLRRQPSAAREDDPATAPWPQGWFDASTR